MTPNNGVARYARKLAPVNANGQGNKRMTFNHHNPAGLIIYALFTLSLMTGCMARREGGAPGIHLGADRFTETLMSPLVGWVQSDVYDSAEGLEIAVLNYGKITFLHPTDFSVKRTTPVSDIRIGYKTLLSLRSDGNLHLIAGGGGYSEVGLYDLTGKPLWHFKVESQYNLNPNRMIASDLDEDGIKEFYVADNQGVFRLDIDGSILWMANARMNYYITALPPENDRPAVVVSDKGMWDSDGNNLQASIASSVGTYKLQSLRINESTYLASGTTSREGGKVFIFDLKGNTIFKSSIRNWGFGRIFAVRFFADEPPYIVVTGGRGGGTTLMSLNIFNIDGTMVYQEYRKAENILVIPNEDAGTDTLLLCTGGIKRLGMVRPAK